MSGGFIPCGEGAGYASGITSAAMDGLRSGRGCLKNITYKSGILNSQKIYDKINQSLANRLSLSA